MCSSRRTCLVNVSRREDWSICLWSLQVLRRVLVLGVSVLTPVVEIWVDILIGVLRMGIARVGVVRFGVLGLDVWGLGVWRLVNLSGVLFGVALCLELSALFREHVEVTVLARCER